MWRNKDYCFDLCVGEGYCRGFHGGGGGGGGGGVCVCVCVCVCASLNCSFAQDGKELKRIRRN